MLEWTRKSFISFFGIVLCLYTIIFVNFSVLKPQSVLSAFYYVWSGVVFFVDSGIQMD